jgi:hypothetical protein
VVAVLTPELGLTCERGLARATRFYRHERLVEVGFGSPLPSAGTCPYPCVIA